MTPDERAAHNEALRLNYFRNADAHRKRKRANQKKHQAKRTAWARAKRATPEGRKKLLAEHRFRKAVRKGLIIRPQVKLQFHHPDYDRPYYGAWVTPEQHRWIHNGKMECPPCLDYHRVIHRKRALAKCREVGK